MNNIDEIIYDAQKNFEEAVNNTVSTINRFIEYRVKWIKIYYKKL
jgi:hypothetical protein